MILHYTESGGHVCNKWSYNSPPYAISCGFLFCSMLPFNNLLLIVKLKGENKIGNQEKAVWMTWLGCTGKATILIGNTKVCTK